MVAVLMTPPYLQFLDANGDPLAGGKVYTYTATGTFSVPKATYTTAAGNISAPNPVQLDSSGRPQTGGGSIWLSGTYDFKVTDSLDNIIETTLNVTAFTTLPSSSDAYFQSFSGTGSQTAFTTSSNLGTDEKAIYVWVDSGLAQCVANGNFATDTIWTKGAGWSIGAGVATATGAISTAISQTSLLTLIQGQAYAVTYTITASAGSLTASVGGNNGVARSSSGTYTEVIIAGSTQILAFTGAGFTGTLDNVSVTVADSKGYEIQNPTSYTINGTSLTFNTAPATGSNNIYVSAPSLLVGAASSSAADAAASAANAATSETNAATSATNAATSATSAAASVLALSGTSSTSIAIGTGAQTFTTQSGKLFIAGQYLQISSNASALNYMHGTVTSYSGTTLVMNITDIGGSGTHTDWNISISGTQGSIGPAGPSGAFSALTGGTNTTAAMVIGSGASLASTGSGSITATALTSTAITTLLGLIFPIGTYYSNETDSTNPATLFGFGTWAAVVDKFIVAHGSIYTSTGGSATSALAAANIPTINSTWNWGDGAAGTTGTNTYASASNSGVTATIKSGTAIATGAIVSNNTSGSSTGAAFSIIPPYQAAYIWKRTA